jgi:hypothetical protein
MKFLAETAVFPEQRSAPLEMDGFEPKLGKVECPISGRKMSFERAAAEKQDTFSCGRKVLKKALDVRKRRL